LTKAKETAMTKTGETSIIRSKLAQTEKEHARHVTALQQNQADATAKYTRELQDIRQEKERVLSEVKFLKQEVEMDAIRLKPSTRAVKTSGQDFGPQGMPIRRSRSSSSPFSTPKKAKSMAFRDGFDDEEITYVSPTKKSADRRKGSLPQLVDQRKRKRGPESPSGPLQLSRNFSEGDVDDREAYYAAKLSETQDASTASGKIEVSKHFFNYAKAYSLLEFVQAILNHKISNNSARTLEELACYRLPSRPSQTLAGKILDIVSVLQSKDIALFSSGFCEELIKLWQVCLEEKYVCIVIWKLFPLLTMLV
jgi:hypothetical protein